MRRSLPLALLSFFALACGGGGDGPTGDPGGQNNPPTPTIALSLSQSSATAVQGTSVTFTATATRSASSVSAIDFAVSGAPSGVTATVGSATTNALVSTSIIGLAVAASTTPGTYTITVTASASGVTSVSQTFTLTIEASTGFTQTVAPSAITIAASQSGQVVVTLARTTYAGSVALSLVNAPTGVTGTFSIPNLAGNTSTLTLNVADNATVGTYTLTVRGVATALADHNSTFSLTIAAKPSIALSSSIAAPSVAQGGAVTPTVTVARTSYTGSLTFALTSNVPAGVTVSFNPVSTTGNTTVVTVNVGANVTVGTFNVIVTATGTGVSSAFVIIPVTVTGPSLRLTLTSTGLLVVQGGPAQTTTLGIVRDQVPGTVNITFEGAPAGMTLSASPSSTTGNTSTINVSATGAVTPGNYNIIIRATPINIVANVRRYAIASAVNATANKRGFALASAVDAETIALSIVVQQAAGGNSTATVDFSSCSVDQRPIWVATQNGDFGFEYKPGTNNVYSWSVSNGKGSIAYVLQGAGGSTTLMFQSMSLAEWTAPGSRVFCVPAASRTVTGTLSNMGANQLASVGLGGSAATVFTALPNFTLNNVPNGTHDLVVYSRAAAGPAATDRMGFLRDVLQATTNVGTFNIGGGGNSFTVSSAPITIAGPIIGNEVFSHGMFYNTGASCATNALYFGGAVTGNTFTAYGAGTASQRATDRHGIYVGVTNGTNASRSVTEYFHDLGARTVTLPSLILNSPPGTVANSNYKRFFYGSNQFPDLTSSITMSYTQVGAPKTITWYATWAWAQSTTMILTVPDLTGTFGWDASWAPAANSATSYVITHTGTNITTNGCTQANARLATATFNGTN